MEDHNPAGVLNIVSDFFGVYFQSRSSLTRDSQGLNSICFCRNPGTADPVRDSKRPRLWGFPPPPTRRSRRHQWSARTAFSARWAGAAAGRSASGRRRRSAVLHYPTAIPLRTAGPTSTTRRPLANRWRKRGSCLPLWKTNQRWEIPSSQQWRQTS